MEPILFAKGLIIGFAMAVPIGPAGILCIHPVTIFAFVAVFAAFGLGQRLFVISAYIPVVGVFIGSCLWFLTLGYVATFFRTKLDSGGLRWVNTIAGVFIILSGVAAFVSLI